ncbi:MAG: hypothetical protein QNJ03_07695 [Dinoroseobacter sp.]|nr:hypothetical protein [Dinoroseobacter sp.]
MPQLNCVAQIPPAPRAASDRSGTDRLGLQARPEKGWGWLTFSGVLSVLIAIFLFSQYPAISIVLLGVFAGASLIGDGAGFLRFAYALKTGEDISVV